MSPSNRTDARFPTSDDAARLLHWLREWAILSALDTVGDDAATGGATPLPHTGAPTAAAPTAAAPTDPEVRAGQIRLWPPSPGDPPLFVAIADPDAIGTGTFPCVPFGRLATPGAPGELASGRTEAPLRVWCLWNARPIAREQLSRTWVADTLPGDALDRLNRALRAWRRAGALPADLRGAAGPPLAHPDDPRRAYLRLEQHRVTRALTMQTESATLVYPTAAPPLETLRAAEDTPPYGDA